MWHWKLIPFKLKFSKNCKAITSYFEDSLTQYIALWQGNMSQGNMSQGNMLLGIMSQGNKSQGKF